MKAGDIIQFDYDAQLSKGWRKWLNKLVKKLDGDVNHSALYFGKGYVIESWDGVGVRKRKLWKWEKYHILRTKPELGLENLQSNLKDYYKNTKGMKYSWRDWVNTGIGKLTYKLFGKRCQLFKNDKEGFICSEYVKTFYWRYYGIGLCEDIKLETPNDFESSKYLSIQL